MVCKFLIDISKVEDSLLAVQKNFEAINNVLDMRREPMRDEIVDNMIAGYDYVNTILKDDINLLKQKGFPHFLELNNIVLCGKGQERRRHYHQHIEATSDRFYQQQEFSIRHLRSWADDHKDDSPWLQAAGVYILLLSWPQLFLEGNHRTGALLLSAILVRLGKPPFVLSVENAKKYFDPSSLAKSTKRNAMGRLYKLPKIKKKFAKFLEVDTKNGFLLPL